MSSDRKQVATEIAKRYTREGTGYADRLYQLAYAIEAALKERDERAAKIVDNWDYERLIPGEVAAAIRNEEPHA